MQNNGRVRERKNRFDCLKMVAILICIERLNFFENQSHQTKMLQNLDNLSYLYTPILTKLQQIE